MSKSEKKTRRKARVLAEQEIQTMIATPKKLRDKILILLLANTGLRRVTISTLKVEYFNFTTGLLEIPNQEKTQTSVRLPLKKEVSDYIQTYIYEKLKNKKLTYLFPGRTNGHLGVKRIEALVIEIAKEARLTNILPHDFRKTFMIRAAKNRVPSNVASSSLGVSEETMKRHYEEYTPEELHNFFDGMQFEP